MGTDLFDVKLGVLKKSQFISVYKLTRIMFVFALITGLFDIYSSSKLLRIYSNLPDNAPGTFKMQSIANIFFLGLYGIFLPIQSYFFYLFISTSKKAIEYKSEIGIYHSFNWLLKQTIVSTIVFGFNAIWAIANILFFK